MASRLRLAVTRLHRRLRQQTVGGLTQSQASALASIAKLGSPTLGALAACESVQPPSMTRVVGALEELGYVSRVIDATDRRVARVTISPEGVRVLEHNRSVKNAFLAQQLRRMAPEERAVAGGPHRASRTPRRTGRAMTALRAAAHQTFSSLRIRNYRLYFVAQLISVSGTWMQTVAQAWLVLRLSGSGVDLGYRGRFAVPAHVAVRTGWWIGGRSGRQAPSAVLHPGRRGPFGPGPGCAGGHRSGPAVAGLPAGRHARRGHRLRQPGPSDLRDGDGRARRPSQCGEPQHGGDERLAGGGPGHRGRGHHRLRARRLLLPQCRLLCRRADRPVADAPANCIRPSRCSGPRARSGRDSATCGGPRRCATPCWPSP